MPIMDGLTACRIVGPETVRRLGQRYHVERLGREHLKNLAEAIDIYRGLDPV